MKIGESDMKTYHVAPGSHGLIVNERPMIGHESSIAFVTEDRGKHHVVLADPNTGICLARTGNGDLLSTLAQMDRDLEDLAETSCLEVSKRNFLNCEEMG